MPDQHIARNFTYSPSPVEVPGGRAYDVVHDGRLIGRVWNRVTDAVWYSSPETFVPHDVAIWYGPSYSRREASLWLAGMNTAHPRYCPSCGAPVIVGDPPIRPLFNRDYTPHSCYAA